jgi:phytoene/squalene synthetase
MRNPTEYRKYAQECERLAEQLPKQHTETLLNIARTWRVCADEMERERERKRNLEGASDTVEWRRSAIG